MFQKKYKLKYFIKFNNQVLHFKNIDDPLVYLKITTIIIEDIIKFIIKYFYISIYINKGDFHKFSHPYVLYSKIS